MHKRESIIYANVNKLLLACIRMLHISVVLANVFKSPIWWCIIYIGEEKVFFSTEGNSFLDCPRGFYIVSQAPSHHKYSHTWLSYLLHPPESPLWFTWLPVKSGSDGSDGGGGKERKHVLYTYSVLSKLFFIFLLNLGVPIVQIWELRLT